MQPARPSLLEVRTYLGAEPLASWSRQVARLSTLTELTPEDHKPYLRALLYPARFLCSWEAGTVTSNDDAVAYVGKRGLLGPDTGIVVRALRCRNEGDSPAPLFPERQRLLRLLDICVGRVGAAR